MVADLADEAISHPDVASAHLLEQAVEVISEDNSGAL